VEAIRAHFQTQGFSAKGRRPTTLMVYESRWSAFVKYYAHKKWILCLRLSEHSG